MNLIMSIKPEWAKKIYSGEKTVEWRKTKPKNFSIENKIFLYETAPIKKVTGYITIFDICEFDNIEKVNDLENNIFIPDFIKQGCVAYEDLKKYAAGKRLFAYMIDKAIQTATADIKYFTKSERPPQSMEYTHAFICGQALNIDHRIKSMVEDD